MRVAVIGLGGQRPPEQYQDLLRSGPVFARDAQTAERWLNGFDIPVINLAPIFDWEDVGAIADAIVREIRASASEFGSVSYLVPSAGNIGDETVRILSNTFEVEFHPGALDIPLAASSLRAVDALSLAIAESSYPFDAGIESLDPRCATVVTNFAGLRIQQLASSRLQRELGSDPPHRRDGTLVYEAVNEPGRTSAFSGLEQIISILRSPGGCPWDREQTVESLIPQLAEELDEFRDAMINGTVEDRADELGDVLLHIVMIAQIAREAGTFTASDVVGAISAKMVRRHPHVFGDREIDTFEDLYSMWDEIKSQEKAN